MKKRILFLVICLMAFNYIVYAQYDLIIVGGNPGGIMAAISAARLGKTSLILERTNHIGGLPANGLGATDIHTRGATTGLFLEFVKRVKKHYITKYGQDSRQVIFSSDGYRFEPAVAEQVFEQMLSEHADKIKVLKMHQFDSDPQNLSMVNDQIQAIKVLNRKTKEIIVYKGKMFLDATYEGDLAAAAKVPFRVGRESIAEFNEPGAGKLYKYWAGPEASGTTNLGDNAVQAYNYRLCLTNNEKNRAPIPKPPVYNRDEFGSLVNDVLTGRHTSFQMKEVTEEMMESNRKAIMKGDTTQIPGDKWGINKISNMVTLPNDKTDANNQHQGFISTDLPEENWPWPTASWEWRDKYAERLKNYTLGLLYFSQHDASLPTHFKKAALEWGLAKDEYTDNNNFPRQVYVREGRRFEGVYFFTAKDALPLGTGQRPPVHASSITSSHYALDSHATLKREAGRVQLDGFFSYATAVYTIPLGVILPKEVDNLIFPVPVSGSHVGFSTLRLEPCWMALGQAAGVAASIAIESKVKVRNIKVSDLQDRLIDQQATLIYFKDVQPDAVDFKMVQVMGLKGFLAEWEAKLDLPVDQATADSWQKLSGLKTVYDAGKTTRRELLKVHYQKVENTAL